MLFILVMVSADLKRELQSHITQFNQIKEACQKAGKQCMINRHTKI